MAGRSGVSMCSPFIGTVFQYGSFSSGGRERNDTVEGVFNRPGACTWVNSRHAVARVYVTPIRGTSPGAGWWEGWWETGVSRQIGEAG